MRKKFALVLCSVFLAGGILYLCGALWSGSFSLPMSLVIKSGQPDSSSDRMTSSNSPEKGDADKEEAGKWAEYDTKMEPFQSMKVEVTALDIHVEIGSAYRLRYRLPSDEVLKRAEVQNGVLCFETDWKENPVHVFGGNRSVNSNGELFITIPDPNLSGELAFSTVSGDVLLPELSCSSLSVDTVSGDVEMPGCVSGAAGISSTSGNVQFSGDCEHFEGELVSGNLTFTGKADKVKVDNISGNVMVTGVCEQIQADTISGDIMAAADDPSVDAEGGTVFLDGKAVDRGTFAREGRGSELTLSSISGRISIETRRE